MPSAPNTQFNSNTAASKHRLRLEYLYWNGTLASGHLTVRAGSTKKEKIHETVGRMFK